MSSVLWFALPVSAQITLERTLEASLSYDDVSQVVVELPEGELQVETSDVWQIALHIQCQLVTSDEAAGNAYLDAIAIQHQFRQEIGSFQAEFPERPESVEMVTYKHTLYLPAEALPTVHIRQDRGMVQLNGLHGQWQVELGTGDIQLVEVTGAFQLTIKEGRLDGTLLLNGPSEFQVELGDIALTVLDSVPQPATFTIGTGSLELALPEGYPAQLDARTERGEIENTIPLETVRIQTQQTLQGTYGQEGPPLTIRITDGDIQLHTFQGMQENDAFETPLASMPLPMTTLPLSEQSPNIDGWLNEAVWRRATRLANFRLADGSLSPEAQTEAYLMRDATHLYLGIRAHEPAMDQLRISEASRDGFVWLDDNLEWMIASTEDGYYDVLVNPIGTVLDRRIDAIPSLDETDMPLEMQLSHAEAIRWDSQIQV